MTARERILDAAASVMRERGIARATTKEIARVAGCSEALLYKYFADKQEIFLGVLSERMPPIAGAAELTGTVRENLETLTRDVLVFYVQTFPIAAAVFSEADLLTAWRDGLRARDAGPHVVHAIVEDYVASERRAGRLPISIDPWATAVLLCGAALQQAFLATFAGETEIPDAGEVAARLVAGVLGPAERHAPPR